MKHTKFILPIFLSIIVSVAFFSFNSKNPSSTKEGSGEVLLVEVNRKANNGIYLYFADKKTEVIPLKRHFLREEISANEQLIAMTFTRLYKEGWIIQSRLGDLEIERFIFVKN